MYDLFCKVTLVDYSSNFIEHPFGVTIINPCDNPYGISMVAGQAMENQEYTITDPAVTYQAPEFVADPVFC